MSPPQQHAALPVPRDARVGGERDEQRRAPPHAPPPSPEPLSVLFRLMLLVNLTARAFAGLYGRRHRISLPEWRVLHALALGHRSAGAMVEALGLDKMAVSRAVRGLEVSGRLVRRPDPRDGRRDVLEVTPAGLALHDEIARTGAQREAAVFGALPPGDLARFQAMLDTLTAAARALPEDAVVARVEEHPAPR